MVDPLEAATRYFAGLGAEAWLVGGRVRDALLGRPGVDTDVVVRGGALDHAAAIARAERAAFVPLDRRRGYARIVWPGAAGAVLDITDMVGGSIEADLAARDFTVNALAVPLGAPLPPDPSRIVDPTGGLADLAARRLRAPSEDAFDADPLRLLRGVRLAATLGFDIDEGTRAAIKARAGLAARPAGERVREELARILATDAPGAVVAELDRLGLLAVVLSGAAPGVGAAIEAMALHAGWREQVANSAAPRDPALGLDGEVSARLPGAPLPAVIARHAAALAAHEADVAPGEMSTVVWTRLSLLLAAGALADRGAPPRPAHRARTAVASAALRLRLSRVEAARIGATARLASAVCDPLSPERTSRRAVYRAYRLGGACAVDAAVVSLAIALTEPKKLAPESTSPGTAERVEATAESWLDGWFAHRSDWIDPRPLLDGRALMESLGLAPGPAVGRLLAGLREAQALGEVTTVGEAKAWARRRLVADG